MEFEEIERSVKMLDDVCIWKTMQNNNRFQHYSISVFLYFCNIKLSQELNFGT